VPCDARSTGWRGETRYARWRELRSPPVLLRFSAAHKARPRRTVRTFAGVVAVGAGTPPSLRAAFRLAHQ
jgi:hypothetical protein